MLVLYFPYFYFFGFFNRDFKPKGDIVRDVCGADGKYKERYQCVVLKDRSGDCLCADICKDTGGCTLGFGECHNACGERGGDDVFNINSSGFNNRYKII